MNWSGVMPAITTPFTAGDEVDFEFMGRHAQWLVANGCSGIVALGSLGEGATLSSEEKKLILERLAGALSGQASVVAAVSSLATKDAVNLAKIAEAAGCKGLMILPPYVYKGDWREMKDHVASAIRATALPCMLYNNPIAYGTDFTPEQIAELAAEHENLTAVKESSSDVRRLTAIRSLVDNRLALLVGVDDAILEGIAAGATGWVAGLADALPRESVELFNRGLASDREEARRLYKWFLPLLRLDTLPKFVQLIKFVQEALGVGSSRVRGPRLRLEGTELEVTQKLIQDAIKTRPLPTSTRFPS